MTRCLRSVIPQVTGRAVVTFRAKKQETAESLIAVRRNRALDRQGFAALLLRVAFIALAGWILLNRIFLVTQVSGNDMFPAVKDGDLAIAFRIQREYVKGDVVIYTANGETRVGRIAARGADVVTLDDSGVLLVNGTNQTGEILYPTYAKDGLEYPYTVLEENVFILGDYRTQTEDSRDFGSVSLENVQAKVITILRRRGL